MDTNEDKQQAHKEHHVDMKIMILPDGRQIIGFTPLQLVKMLKWNSKTVERASKSAEALQDAA